MHPAWKAVLAAAVLGLLLPTVSGQALDPVVVVEADAERVLVPFDEARVVTWTVRNDGPLQATVSLALGVDGPWSSDFGDRYETPFALASGAVRTFAVRLSPTTDTTQAIPEGAVVLTAEATDGAGRTDAASAGVVLAYGPAPLPPMAAPPDHTLRNSLLGTGAALLLLAAVHAALGRTVAVRPTSDTVHLGSLRGAWMRMEVVNRAPWRRSVQVRLRRGAGVVATTDSDRVDVAGRGRTALTLFVRSADGEGRVCVEVRTRGQPWRRRASLRVVPVPAPPVLETPVARPA